MTTKQLTRRQVRWSEFLSQFDYICSWRPGKLSAKPDALTRRPQDLPSSPADPRILFQQQALLKPDNLDPKIKDELHHPQLNPAFPDLDFDRELLLAPLSIEPEPEPLDHKITRLLDEGYKTDK
jgi:hypothetical protein